jgi:outer membrane protein assembly factor BamB
MDGGTLGADWPQWRGPGRNGVSAEKGLLAKWPDGGLRLAWRAGGLGRGYSSPIIAGGTIYITGDSTEKLEIFALSPDGKTRWKVGNGKPWKKPTPGSRSSCCYSDGLLYHMNAHGRLVCLDPADGSEKWCVDIMKKYGTRKITWGLSESVLALDDMVIVTPGSKKAMMVALDKKTGDQVWASQGTGKDQPAYASAIVVDQGGTRQVVNCTAANVFGVDAKTGKLLWKCAHEMKGPQVLTSPSYAAGRIYVPSTFRSGAKSYCVHMEGGKGRVDWVVAAGDPTGSAIVTEKQIVVASSHKPSGWSCYDPATGKRLAQKGDIGYGAAVLADGKYYCLTHRGRMLLMDVATGGFDVISKFDFQSGKKDVWAHPVVCNGRLYLRYHDALSCYDVNAR